MSHPGLLLIALSACAGDKSLPDPDSDTGPVADDSAAPDDTDPGVEDPVLSGLATLPEDCARQAPLSVAATLIRFSDGPAVGGALRAGAVEEDGRFSLVLPQSPPEADLAPLEATLPTLSGALYALVAFEDEDGDGAWQEGEPLRGLAMDRWLAWTTGDPGWPEGWWLVDLGLGGQYAPNRCLLDTTAPLLWAQSLGFPVAHDWSEGVEIPLRGLPARLTLGGTVGLVSEGRDRLLSLPTQAVSDPDLGYSPLFDVALGADTWSASLEEEPPAAHDYGSDPDWRYSVNLNLLYADADADGQYSEGDALSGFTTCADGKPVYTRYTRAVSSYRGYRFLDCYSGNVGWRVARSDSAVGTVYLSSAEAAALEIDEARCDW